MDLTQNKVELLNIKGGNRWYKGFLAQELTNYLISLKNKLKPKSRDKIITLSRRQIQRYLSTIFEEYFNKDLAKDDRKNRVVIHTLRHTFASYLALRNANLILIKKLLDHKDIKDTMRYAKMLPESGQKEFWDLWKP